MSEWSPLDRDTADALEPWEIEMLLASLTEKSLVVSDGTGRYLLLETVRDYGRGILAKSTESTHLREVHSHYYVALAETLAGRRDAGTQRQRFQELDAESDNLRAAFDWSMAHSGFANALRLCAALHPFWAMRGQIEEGRAWCASAIEKAEAHSGELALCRSMRGAALLAQAQGDYAAARSWNERALEASQLGGHLEEVAQATYGLGTVAVDVGELERARTLLEQALILNREVGNLAGVSAALNGLGKVHLDDGNLDLAEEVISESLRMSREQGHAVAEAMNLTNLGIVAQTRHDLPQARRLYEEALSIARAVGNRPHIAGVLGQLGMVLHRMGDRDGARAHLLEALQRNLQDGSLLQVGCSLDSLAAIASDCGDYLRAAKLYGAAAVLLEKSGVGTDDTLYGSPEYRETTRLALGEETFMDAYRQGRQMTLSEAERVAAEGDCLEA